MLLLYRNCEAHRNTNRTRLVNAKRILRKTHPLMKIFLLRKNWFQSRRIKDETQEGAREKIKCGPGQPPEPHCFAEFPACFLPPRSGGMMLIRPQRLRSATFAERVAHSRSLDQGCTTCFCQRPIRSKSNLERPQRPLGIRNALTRVSGRSRRRLTLVNRRLPLALLQSSGKLRNSHVGCIHSAADCFAPQLQNAFRLCRSCGRSTLFVESRGKLRTNFQPQST